MKIFLFLSIISTYCLFANMNDELRLLNNTLLNLESVSKKLNIVSPKPEQLSIENIQFVTDIDSSSILMPIVLEFKQDLNNQGISLESVAKNNLVQNAAIGFRIEFVTGRFMGQNSLIDYKDEDFGKIKNLFYIYIVADPGIATPIVEDPIYGVFAYPIMVERKSGKYEILPQGKEMIQKISQKILSIEPGYAGKIIHKEPTVQPKEKTSLSTEQTKKVSGNIQFTTSIGIGSKPMIALLELENALKNRGISLESIAQNSLIQNAELGLRIEVENARFMGQTTLIEVKDLDFKNIKNLIYIYMMTDPQMQAPVVEDPANGVFAYPIRVTIKPDKYEIASEGKAMIQKIADKIISIKSKN